METVACLVTLVAILADTVNAQLAQVILSPDCGSGPTNPCTVLPVSDSNGDYVYDYTQETCDTTSWACQATVVTTDPTWFCYSTLSSLGGGYQTRNEIGAGLGGLPVGKKEDNYASCQVSRLQDLLTLGNCRDVTLWTCNDCIQAYTRWMCALMFPKCIPYPFHFSIPKKNASTVPTAGIKAPLIWGYGGTSPDYVVNPCFDICYDVVRKCPPSLQFSCPTDSRNYGNPPDCNDLT